MGVNGRAVLEYAIFMIIIITALLAMKGPIVRAFNGHWKVSGDSFAFGRQYDPQKTVECSFDAESNQWYDQHCYAYYVNSTGCNGNALCEQGVVTQCAATNCGKLNNGAAL